MSYNDRNFPEEENPGEQVFNDPVEPDSDSSEVQIEEINLRPETGTGDETRIFARTSSPQSAVSRFFRKAKRVLSEADSILIGDEKPSTVQVVRRKTRRWGCLGAALYFLLVVSTAALLAVVGWQAACDVLGLSDGEVEVQVTIDSDDTLNDVIAKLKDAGMIRYSSLFRLYAEYSHAMDKIDPGTYTLSTAYDYRALVSSMIQYNKPSGTVDVTIPEGYTVDQIFALLADKGVCLLSDIETIAADYVFEYDFLEGIEYGDPARLEGYLFPDTYQFYIDDDPVSVIEKMLDNFDTRLTDELRQAIDASGYSMRDIIIIASMIEKEAYVNTDRPLIASVIYNRLDIGMRLQIDATVLYALGVHKDIVTYEDIEVDSPYNTYMYEGLPPGPISNPGIESIKAALEPAETGYYYYVLTDNGSHYFCVTYEEQQAFIAQQEQ